jgi:hypothetical protein
VLREEKKRFSMRAGAEATIVVSIKQGVPTKTTVEGPVAD